VSGSCGILAPIVWLMSTRIRAEAFDANSRADLEVDPVLQEITALAPIQERLALFNWLQIAGIVMLILATLGAYLMIKPSGTIASLTLAAISAGAVLSVAVRAIDLGVLYAIVPEFIGTAEDANRTGLINSHESIVPVQNLASDLSLALRSGIGALLLCVAIIRAGAFPKWFGWVSFVVAIAAWLELVVKMLDTGGDT